MSKSQCHKCGAGLAWRKVAKNEKQWCLSGPGGSPAGRDPKIVCPSGGYHEPEFLLDESMVGS